MTDPITQQPFNLLSYVPALALALALAAGWADLKSDITTSEQRTSSIEGMAASRAQSESVHEAEQEGRLRSLEIGQTRSDEKFNAILDALERLEQRLESP
jgi:hypothetical protein